MITIRFLCIIMVFDWMKFFSAFIPVPIDDSEELVTYSPDYLKHMTDILEKASKRYESRFNEIIFIYVIRLGTNMYNTATLCKQYSDNSIFA